MTQNPFGEGFDMNAMLEKAQQMQAQLMQAQDELAAEKITGSTGGVTVTVTGVGEMVGVEIAPGTVTDDPDSLTDLGDLIVAAYRDAKAQADAKAAQAFGPVGGGLGDLGLGGGPVV
ncbi:MAG: nucleoid-associated protein [Myxococcales bacterium]|nr:MAG: nucleoid-associated protein [Myxococcales bacterium]